MTVLIVGAGIAGVACARTLTDAGIEVELIDRGSAIGGRLCTHEVHGRPVDLGASYVTATTAAFQTVVADWAARGLATPWSTTFAVAEGNRLTGSTSGPIRYGTRGGLRSLVLDLADGIPIRHADVAEVAPGPTVDGEPADAVVLAMPDPQACDVLSEDFVAERRLLCDAEWLPVLALAAGWAERTWPEVQGVFVNDAPALSFVADDGRRRGDGAPVLVAHSTPEFAERHLDDPDEAVEPMLAALADLLHVHPPEWHELRRWSLARPASPRRAAFHLGGAGIGLCGDGWHAPSRVESAYLSGRALGQALAARLGR